MSRTKIQKPVMTHGLRPTQLGAKLGAGLFVATAACALGSASGGCSAAGNSSMYGNAGGGGQGGSAGDQQGDLADASTAIRPASSGTGIMFSGTNIRDASQSPGRDCVNLECQQTSCTAGACKQKACTAGQKTSVHGTIYDPAGKVPLYNVVVYVPNGEVPALSAGATCDRCDARAIAPITSALTDTKGNFVLNDVPVGSNIPLVIQVGKWRRQVKIPTVTACQDLALTDVNLTRLPRNQAEGDIPLIAITTGGADSMECLPRRMGIDDSEFTTEAGKGRIHLYGGGDNIPRGGGQSFLSTKVFDTTLNAGAAMTPATTVWADVDHLKKYDLVILSCEGALNETAKPPSALKAMYDYESLGGRVFGSHWHRYWFSNGPAPVPSIATWQDVSPDPTSPTPGTIDTSFPKGKALSEWLVNVGASMTPGQLSISDGRENVQAVDPMLARQWITIQADSRSGLGGRGGGMAEAGTAGATHTVVEYLSYNAPIGVPEAQQCGRAVFNDLHVSTSSASGKDTPGKPFPTGCQVRELTAQEKAVEFLLFDLSACVEPDDKPPQPPPGIN